ncbi:hypothetical protein [Treponema sp.]|uniref:hypothetical protein n=1 Tax=Treponema sp. TaxID=166 RepID=UPI00298DF6D2|nr:hypothetical protein [Treponema sp.]MCR5612687.1 hypothetical protein [Treponema sp.]
MNKRFFVFFLINLLTSLLIIGIVCIYKISEVTSDDLKQFAFMLIIQSIEYFILSLLFYIKHNSQKNLGIGIFCVFGTIGFIIIFIYSFFVFEFILLEVFVIPGILASSLYLFDHTNTN